MAFSALMVPVPELDDLLRPVRHADDLGAHITLLSPFVEPDALTDGVTDELASLFADVLPFAFRVAEVCQFPGGTVYLAPDPPTPFRQLTLELLRRFPEHPPYGGRFDDVVPHLTVPAEAGSLPEVERWLAGRLPRAALAREAVLVRVGDGPPVVLGAFGFGTAAA